MGETTGIAWTDATWNPMFVKQASGLYPGRQGELPDSLWVMKQMPGEKSP